MTSAIAAPISTHWHWRDQAIHYVKAGQPRRDLPPLLLVHGFGGSTDHWRKNIAGLQTEFEVWAIDLLGFGRSAKPDWQYSGDLWRDQLSDFINQVIGRPAVLAGNSLGGYASLCVAAQRPEAAAGLVLLNSAGPFSETDSEASPKAQPNPIRKAIAKTVQNFMLQPLPNWLLFQYVRRPSTIRKTLKQVYVDHSAITDQLVEDIRRPSCDPGAAKVFTSIFKSPRGANVDELLKQLTCPLLMLWGEGDPWIDARSRGAKFRQYYPNLSEHYLQAGHCPHDEVPDQVNALLADWITQVVGPQSV
ncbi:MAG: alpha/beta fold hydrolase [Cyanobacteria bacterium J06635_15]